MGTAEENGLEAKYERDNYVEKGTGFETGKMIKDEEKNNLVVEIETDPKQHILYKAGDHPPIYLTIFCGFQHTLVSLSNVMAVSLLVSDVTCANLDDDIKSTLLSSTMLMSGVCTVMMCLLGSRLPLFQGAASEFLIPLLAMQVLDKSKCDFPAKIYIDTNSTITNTSGIHLDQHSEFILKNIRECFTSISRSRKLQGSLVAAGTIQFLIGATGLVSLLLKFIGPITIVPTLLLITVFLVRACVKFASVNWGIALMVAAVSLILSLYLSHHNTPIPMWTRKRGFHILWFPLHQVYSILIGILVGWFVCGVMTVAGTFSPDDKLARTDTGLDAIRKADWFRLPYPGQFGSISFSASIFMGFFIGTIMSILDSIGDYYACAKICNLPPPPAHCVNRGIAIEGFCSLIAGFLGCGHATTTYGGNIGAIGVTKVASRDVFIATGVIYFIFGIIGKISAVFLTIPYPVLGGALIVMFGMFNGVVLSNLQVVSLSSTRNLAIMGTAILFGFMIPYWLETNPDAIQTGTLKERGIEAWQIMIDDKADNMKEFDGDVTIYDIPLPRYLKKSKVFRRLPFIPPVRE
ncbi:solute carrier family 23 member 1 isoform X4 [Magallana gigas]|uniref:solute carrier family 23 member 1 isoform X4 n=1 Tax=Magallana gigas TaxID=29159 RepID=UPI00333EDE98